MVLDLNFAQIVTILSLLIFLHHSIRCQEENLSENSTKCRYRHVAKCVEDKSVDFQVFFHRKLFKFSNKLIKIIFKL